MFMSKSTIVVPSSLTPDDWDTALAHLRGHPLQTALWGQARLAVDRIPETRWVVKEAGEVVLMARVEERRIPGLGRVAWIPRGPTVHPKADQARLAEFFRQHLHEQGYILAVMTQWREQFQQTGSPTSVSRAGPQQTLWIDLQLGRDRLWQALDKQWRYGVGRAERSGVSLEQTVDPEVVDRFFQLCRDISQVKGFNLPASAPLMQRLIGLGRAGPVQARLFVAQYEGRLGAGAFILRCGDSIHYLWGGTDRELSKLRVGEAVQWAVIEWALAEGCRLYDLEGIDPVNNPGTYAFKKKMGGREVHLAPRTIWPLTLRGRLLARFL